MPASTVSAAIPFRERISERKTANINRLAQNI
jgi:hypothetical protein